MALDPAIVSTPKEEKILMRMGVKPIGSRRRRAALQTAANIPFEQLPYQCFQEARKILLADREEKLEEIEVERSRIARLKEQDAAVSGGEQQKQTRLRSMMNYLEELKILADINDPVIKKRYEDGEGDMNKPIYRYLADKEWRRYRRPLLMQRITQMAVVPDILPHLDPVVDIRLAFGRHNVQPGNFIDSRVSEMLPKLRVQVFDKGERLVSLVVVDPDVPDVESDSFKYRCHFLAANIRLSPAEPSLAFSKLSGDTQVLLPWLPPFAQKGSPYHRNSIFLLQQPDGKEIDIASLREKVKRDGFNLRSFSDKHSLRPVGVHMFRSTWDDGTASVMKRAGIEGADVEFKRKRVEPLKKPVLPLPRKKAEPLWKFR
ncbi:hypothetical protein FGG08_000260 [Glutinoglossum americanum]|uniref:Large ribosomal subunit protein mL38 n=1 Tax=Glutinoglossum americanum TaxID=1670608 RepID=A0A9P8I453_9PEZI|nr:hypothetical protein FGG08_000260 [Glutinoglossum americanum]